VARFQIPHLSSKSQPNPKFQFSAADVVVVDEQRPAMIRLLNLEAQIESQKIMHRIESHSLVAESNLKTVKALLKSVQIAI